MSIWQILILALVQGAAELLPVSSSAHVILAQRLMGLDSASPPMTFLLVMLHTGTMLAVLWYFRKRWARLLNAQFIRAIVIATVATGVLGFGLKVILEKLLLERYLHYAHGEIHDLFGFLPLIGAALIGAGALILIAGLQDRSRVRSDGEREVSTRHSWMIGLVQGLCLPFRGFSRSGATISTGLLCGVSRELAEEFSFALAVVLTPPVLVIELHHLLKHSEGVELSALLGPGLIGMGFSMIAGLIALKFLSRWLENGKWHYFGYYCLVFAGVVFAASAMGF